MPVTGDREGKGKVNPIIILASGLFYVATEWKKEKKKKKKKRKAKNIYTYIYI
jgi:hypothetical protein